MAKSKRKTRSTGKTSRKVTSSRSGKKSAARKKPAARKKTKKKTAGKKSARRTKTSASKKKTKKKSAARPSARKRKSPSKKRAAKKKTSRKKSAVKKSKKKPTAKKKSKKKVAAKSPAGRKITSKKTKTKTKKKTGRKKTESTSTKKTSKKKSRKSGAGATGAKPSLSKGRGRSVAEVASAAPVDEKGYVFINGRRVRMISTQGKTFTKRRTRTEMPTVKEEKQEPAKITKTHLSRKELNHYKNLLMIKRAELVGDLSAMEAEALRSNVGNISHMPIHMADIGSDAYEQDFMLGLAETERKQIREIDEALQRIADRIYGICMLTGKPIPKARLDAKPWARYTIEAARIMESQQP